MMDNNRGLEAKQNLIYAANASCEHCKMKCDAVTLGLRPLNLIILPNLSVSRIPISHRLI